jgi:hypothetical protein
LVTQYFHYFLYALANHVRLRAACRAMCALASLRRRIAALVDFDLHSHFFDYYRHVLFEWFEEFGL